MPVWAKIQSLFPPGALQPPSELGCQSGTLKGEFMWVNAKSFLTQPRSPPAKLGEGLASAVAMGNQPAHCPFSGWACPQIEVPCVYSMEGGKTLHPFWSNIVLHPQILREFPGKTSGPVRWFWFGWFCFANSVWDESYPLLSFLPPPPPPNNSCYFWALL